MVVCKFLVLKGKLWQHQLIPSSAVFFHLIISDRSVAPGLAGWTSCIILSLDFDRAAPVIYLPRVYWSLSCLTSQIRKMQRLLNSEPFHMNLNKQHSATDVWQNTLVNIWWGEHRKREEFFFFSHVISHSNWLWHKAVRTPVTYLMMSCGPSLWEM